MMSIRALVFLLIGSLVTTAVAAEPMPLDIFSVSGQPLDVWKPSGETEPARPARLGAHAATEFICPFAKLPIRGSWDYSSKFDLSSASRFRFQVRTDHPDHIRRATLYFRSGAGWYAGAFELNQSGTTTVELASQDMGAVSVGSAQLSFTSATFDQAQTVSVNGVGDMDLADESVGLDELALQ